LQIHAIFILLEPVYWDESIQIICDLVTTENGKVAEKRPAKGPDRHIPIYCSLNDITYKDKFQLPRMVNGCFISSLRLLHKELYGTDLQIEFYGKPQVRQFKFVENHAMQFLDDEHEVSNFYMIGDNPSSDIKGANDSGWQSILVRTGLFKNGENSKENPAKYVVQDFAEAVKLIFQLEGIQCEK
jgi:HAD superfamily hydrolase (TIGR01456 family)